MKCNWDDERSDHPDGHPESLSVQSRLGVLIELLHVLGTRLYGVLHRFVVVAHRELAQEDFLDRWIDNRIDIRFVLLELRVLAGSEWRRGRLMPQAGVGRYHLVPVVLVAGLIPGCGGCIVG